MEIDQSLIGKVNSIDLEPIVYKLVSCPEGPQWTFEQAFHAEKWYRRFLFLILRNNQESVIPTSAIDEIWHFHMLDSRKYMKDCDLLFGQYLHHFPYLGLRGDADVKQLHDAFEKTLGVFRDNFGEDPQDDESRLFKVDQSHAPTTCGGSCGKTCGRGTCASDGISNADPWQIGLRPTLGSSYSRQTA